MTKEAFRSVAVIGAAGQTGRFFTETLGFYTRVQAVVREYQLENFSGIRFGHHVSIHSEIGRMLETQPEAVILATPNSPKDAKKIFDEIAEKAKAPLTLVLPQNGVGIAEVALKSFKDSGARINLVRASLYTVVSDDGAEGITYNRDRKRIVLAPVTDDQKNPVCDDESLQKTHNTFENAGFDVKLSKDYRATEFSKAVVNCFGSIVAVTLSKETFRDPVIFDLEMRGLKDRFALLEQNGIPYEGVWGGKYLPWLARLPVWVSSGLLRGAIARKITEERNGQLPAAARLVVKGKNPAEAADQYHGAFVEIGDDFRRVSPIDLTIQGILNKHIAQDINLNLMSESERVNFLREVVKIESERPFTQAIGIITATLEAWAEFCARTYETPGQENLDKAQKYLDEGSNVLLIGNHESHSDHPYLILALKRKFGNKLREYSPTFIAGTRFKKELLARVFRRGYDRILVWADEQNSNEEKWKANIVNRKALHAIRRIFKAVDKKKSAADRQQVPSEQERGKILIVYPRGTRIKDGEMDPAKPGVSAYVKEGWIILPAYFKGTGEVLPPGKPTEQDLAARPWLFKLMGELPKIGLVIKKTHWPKRADITVRFGEPKRAEEILAEANATKIEVMVDGEVKMVPIKGAERDRFIGKRLMEEIRKLRPAA